MGRHAIGVNILAFSVAKLLSQRSHGGKLAHWAKCLHLGQIQVVSECNLCFKWLNQSSNVLYPRAFFLKNANGCLVHHYSYPSAQFVENYTLDQFVENYTLDQFVKNYTLDQFDGNYTLDQFVENYTPGHLVWVNTGGTRAIFTDRGTRVFFPHTDSITFCEQASSAAQACKE